MSLAERLLVHTDPCDVIVPPPFKAAFDRPLHNGMQLVPTQAEQVARILQGTAGEDHLDSKGLEELSKARMLARPGKSHGFDAMLIAFAAGRFAMQVRAELHGIKMPPRPPRRTVVYAAGLPHFRALSGQLAIIQ